MYYITICEDGFGFKVPDIHIINEADKHISDEIYNRFFEEYQPISDTTNDELLSETDELKQRVAQLEAIVETLLKDKQS